MDKEILIDFYRKIYEHSIQDRESIQSKLTLFLYISISSFIFVVYAFNHFTANKLNTTFAIFIIIINLVILIYSYKIFIMHEYAEMPIPNKLEEYRKALIDNKKEFNITDEVLDYYARAASENFLINKTRRAKLSVLVYCSFALGVICFSWCAAYLFSKIFS
ncbi:MAG: hypothetical protein AB7I18_11155 [Candidatus Berkiella sp.]